jgi:hypothetical protein
VSKKGKEMIRVFGKAPNKMLQALAISALLLAPLSSNAHILGLSWDDLGNNTVRFYGEVAHDLTAMGFTEDSPTMGGGLLIGPWATRQYHAWTGIRIGTTFAELGIDGYSYWDYTDNRSTIGDYHPDSHREGPESSGDFFFVDVNNFVSGDYLLQGFNTNAVERPVSWNYLDVHIDVQEPQDDPVVSSVPEPSIAALFGIGLIGLWARRRSTLTKA